MKKPKCYNCKHKSEDFKIMNLTHTHCVNPKLYKEEDFVSGKCGGWDTLRVFSDTCEEHEFKDFKPCGEGDNICNCKVESECGYK